MSLQLLQSKCHFDHFHRYVCLINPKKISRPISSVHCEIIGEVCQFLANLAKKIRAYRPSLVISRINGPKITKFPSDTKINVFIGIVIFSLFCNTLCNEWRFGKLMHARPNCWNINRRKGSRNIARCSYGMQAKLHRSSCIDLTRPHVQMLQSENVGGLPTGLYILLALISLFLLLFNDFSYTN